MSKKDEIMDCAIKLFLKKGFSNVSNSDIINASGVGSGTIYYHFEDKDDLILSVIDKYFIEVMHQRLDIVKSFEEDLYSTLQFLFKQISGIDDAIEPYSLLGDSPEYSSRNVLFLACEGIQKYESVSKKFDEFNYVLEEYIIGLVEKGKENNEIRKDFTTKELSQLIQSNLNGIFFMNIIQININTPEIIESDVRHLYNYIKS